MPKSSETKLCQYCQKERGVRGFPNHERACKKKYEEKEVAADFRRRKGLKELGAFLGDTNPQIHEEGERTGNPDDSSQPSWSGDIEFEHPEGHDIDACTQTQPAAFGNEQDAFQTVYHPSSGRPTITQRFEEYGMTSQEGSPIPPGAEPWRPFRTRIDFEVAELALCSAMNAEQTTTLIRLLQCVARGFDRFTLDSHAEMQATWDLAAERSTKFSVEKVTVPYREEPQDFEIHFRPLWDWLLEMLLDREIVTKMEWDARRVYKFNGNKWCRFIHEPWTAERWWTLQSESIPAAGKPLCLLIYADKNKLSSFGSAKGYPVIARVLNLPEHIRNSTGPGGGRVVGWLPIVTEDAERTHKTDFVDFKAIVWHESARRIFASIVQYSQSGCSVRCGDDIRRLIYPLIMIDSADYEEQCIMCVIRGLMGLCPCPKCFIPKDELWDLTNVSAPRTAQHAVETHNTVLGLNTKAEQEEHLKQYSMRPVSNVFLGLANSDPYRALKRHVAKIGRAANVKLDKRFNMVPPWRGLNHFEQVTTVSFNDGSHHRDISKIFLFAAHGVISDTNDKAAYCLLKTLRKYLNLYMYSALDVQTEETIALGRQAVAEFHTCLQEYREFEFDDPKLEKESWNFIKLHYVVHLFEDIEQKGAQRGFNTMPNEKLHGPLRKIYKLMTNFKDVAKQILRIEHQCLIAGIIRGQLEMLDEVSEDDEGGESTADPHIFLGSKCRLISFEQFEQDRTLDPSFSRFRIRLSDFMSNLLPLSSIPLPAGRRINFQAHEQILPYQFLKVGYESTETWRLVTDYLRCNPSFNGKPRYDFVLFDTPSGPTFAQLCYVFKCFITSDGGDVTEYPIALVQGYTVVQQRPRMDKELGLLRLRKQSKTEFISVRSIIRGALVIGAMESENPNTWLDVFVIDVVDADMFLRINEYFPGFTKGT
ncbi:hypothetical protein PM082_012470 [Marasmius tenuissimus]|nr:hypothetical protein PM082_012470 [Marasmius tenuissimus]